MMGLNGFPDCRFTIGEALQPLTSRLRAPASALNGRRYVPLSTNRCVASKSERARSTAKFRKFWTSGFELPTEFVSIDLENVYDEENVRPFANLRSTLSHM